MVVKFADNKKQSGFSPGSGESFQQHQYSPQGMKHQGDYDMHRPMYPQVIYPHNNNMMAAGSMISNSQMTASPSMHSHYDYHYPQHYPQSPVSGMPHVPVGDYIIHMESGQPMQNYQKNSKPFNRKFEGQSARPVSAEEEEGYQENQNSPDDYTPHFRTAANSRPPEGMLHLCLQTNT